MPQWKTGAGYLLYSEELGRRRFAVLMTSFVELEDRNKLHIKLINPRSISYTAVENRTRISTALVKRRWWSMLYTFEKISRISTSLESKSRIVLYRRTGAGFILNSRIEADGLVLLIFRKQKHSSYCTGEQEKSFIF
jgi:hypothetical protein